jgi:hypothetical protein
MSQGTRLQLLLLLLLLLPLLRQNSGEGNLLFQDSPTPTPPIDTSLCRWMC